MMSIGRPNSYSFGNKNSHAVWKQVCFPSGIMANQTAIKVNTQPGEQLIADKYAHVYHYEGGGVSSYTCCFV
jgi:threonine aldolase